jgi:7,8-dihydropterin-6-yl-methyl-4-(beta-D-ribofuranosyl)aminobenzene 5'-phosphate synthase
MKLNATLLLAGALASTTVLQSAAKAFAADTDGQVTILYDAFGKDGAMKKDWGFSALVEVEASAFYSTQGMIATFLPRT